MTWRETLHAAVLLVLGTVGCARRELPLARQTASAPTPTGAAAASVLAMESPPAVVKMPPLTPEDHACPRGGAPGRLDVVVCGPNVYVGFPGSISVDGQFVARTTRVDAGSMENVLPEWLRVKRVSDDATVALFTLIAVNDVDDLFWKTSDQGEHRGKKARLELETRTAKANAWLAKYTWRAIADEGDPANGLSATVRLSAEVEGNRVRLKGATPGPRRTTWTTLRTFNLAGWMPVFPDQCFVDDPPAYALIGGVDQESGIALIDLQTIVHRCVPPPNDFHIVRVDRKWLLPL